MHSIEILAIVLCGAFLAGGIYLIMVSDKLMNKKDDDHANKK